MPAREGALDQATRKAHRTVAELGRELRDGRLAHGIGQGLVGRRIGLSASQVSRIERGMCRTVSLVQLAQALAVVGLDLSVRAYPGVSPIRDAGHARLLAKLRAVLPRSAVWGAEAPLPIAGDGRAWDAVIKQSGACVGVDAETRPRDLQAHLRAVRLKSRDSGIPIVILLLADTRHNRRLVREYGDLLASHFPLDGKTAIAQLRAGLCPASSAVVLL